MKEKPDRMSSGAAASAAGAPRRVPGRLSDLPSDAATDLGRAEPSDGYLAGDFKVSNHL